MRRALRLLLVLAIPLGGCFLVMDFEHYDDNLAPLAGDAASTGPFLLDAIADRRLALNEVARLHVAIRRAPGFTGDVTIAAVSVPLQLQIDTAKLTGAESTAELTLTAGLTPLRETIIAINAASANASATARFKLSIGSRLDQGYGDGGVVLTSVASPTQALITPRGVVTLLEEEASVCGAIPRIGTSSSVSRLAFDGALDSTFGSDGKAITEQGVMTAIAVDDLGQPLLVSTRTKNRLVARLSVDGKDAGTTTTPVALMGSGSEVSLTTAWLSGQPLAASTRSRPSMLIGGATTYLWDIERYADGGIDPTFNFDGGGLVPDQSYTRRLSPTPTGQLMVASDHMLRNEEASTRIVLQRLSASGAIDPAFNGGATSLFAVPDGTLTSACTRALGRDGAGRYVVAAELTGADRFGCRSRPSSRIGLARVRDDGTVDPAFGPGGLRTFPALGESRATALAFQPDGKLLVVGSMNGGGSQSSLLIVRLRDDGELDPSFHEPPAPIGITLDLGAEVLPLAAGVVDDRLLVVGCVNRSASSSALFLVRYTL